MFAVHSTARLHQRRLYCDTSLIQSAAPNGTIQWGKLSLLPYAFHLLCLRWFFYFYRAANSYGIYVGDKQIADVMLVWSTASSSSLCNLWAILPPQKWLNVNLFFRNTTNAAFNFLYNTYCTSVRCSHSALTWHAWISLWVQITDSIGLISSPCPHAALPSGWWCEILICMSTFIITPWFLLSNSFRDQPP